MYYIIAHCLRIFANGWMISLFPSFTWFMITRNYHTNSFSHWHWHAYCGTTGWQAIWQHWQWDMRRGDSMDQHSHPCDHLPAGCKIGQPFLFWGEWWVLLRCMTSLNKGGVTLTLELDGAPAQTGICSVRKNEIGWDSHEKGERGLQEEKEERRTREQRRSEYEVEITRGVTAAIFRNVVEIIQHRGHPVAASLEVFVPFTFQLKRRNAQKGGEISTSNSKKRQCHIACSYLGWIRGVCSHDAPCSGWSCRNTPPEYPPPPPIQSASQKRKVCGDERGCEMSSKYRRDKRLPKISATFFLTLRNLDARSLTRRNTGSSLCCPGPTHVCSDVRKLLLV